MADTRDDAVSLREAEDDHDLLTFGEAAERLRREIADQHERIGLLEKAGRAAAGGATVVPVYATPCTELLSKIAQQHADGTTRVEIQAVYPLSNVDDAFAAFTRGHTRQDRRHHRLTRG